jgi:DNA-directed RNA polymerase subunit omega
MLEELRDTKIIDKVGGRFKLTALIQKRLIELLEGARPLIENTEGKTRLEIVVQEILQDKITMEFPTSTYTETQRLRLHENYEAD